MIRLVVVMYVRFPLFLRNAEDLLAKRGIDISHETVRLWWNKFGPLFAGDIRRRRCSRMRDFDVASEACDCWVAARTACMVVALP